MHVHPPKPLHGWRELFGEIGVIVIGVCIALAAEQTLDWLHWRKEMAETREALKTELARAVGAYQFNLAQQTCANARLDELTQWLDASKVGEAPPLTRPIGNPGSYSLLEGAWDTAKTGQAAWRMPIEQRLRFAHLYGSLEVADGVMKRGSEAWRSLNDFTGSEPLDHQDRVRMRGLIAQARAVFPVLSSDGDFINPDIAPLGITPEKRPPLDTGSRRAFCQPLFAAPPVGKG